jgi:hypothetical protein
MFRLQTGVKVIDLLYICDELLTNREADTGFGRFTRLNSNDCWPLGQELWPAINRVYATSRPSSNGLIAGVQMWLRIQSRTGKSEAWLITSSARYGDINRDTIGHLTPYSSWCRKAPRYCGTWAKEKYSLHHLHTRSPPAEEIATFTMLFSLCCTKHCLDRFFAVSTRWWSNPLQFLPLGHLINYLALFKAN